MPVELHSLIQRGLNLWIGRKMLIPTELLTILTKNPNLRVTNPEHQMIIDALNGRIQVKWLKKGEMSYC